MDIREWVFRHLHSATEPKDPDYNLRTSTIKNDPECRDMCGRFLFTEIFLEGNEHPEDFVYEPDVWEPRAEYFINHILPSSTFMHDCIDFFARIREDRL